MADPNDGTRLRTEQYGTGANLNARIALHQRFRTGPVAWHEWAFERMSIPARANVLELGCGTGLFWRAMGDRASPDWTLILTDFSEGMLREARVATATLPCRGEVAVADAEAIPLGAHSVDVVVANHMLYHVPDRDRALQEIRRVLVPGGVFHAATIGKGHLHQLDDVIAANAPGAPSVHRVTARFDEETGPEQLRRWFPTVRVEVFEDELHVTDADAISAYIRSTGLGSRLDPKEMDAIMAAVHGEIDARGALVLDTRSAFFVCRV